MIGLNLFNAKGRVMDKIIYTVVSAPGGCDGRDHNDKGGKVLLATFSKAQAEQKISRDSRYLLEKSVMDTYEGRRAALAKLTLVDRLILNV